jgi:peptide/nickel transport system substrate-binding protein
VRELLRRTFCRVIPSRCASGPSPIFWFWDGYWDPGSTLQCFTTSQIGWWNEVYRSNAEYDNLCNQQGRELDAQKRADLIHQMQQVMYAENPQDVLTYFDYLQAVNVEKWDGWTPYYNAEGPVFYNGILQSYLNVRPKAVAASSGAGSGNGAFVVVAAVVVAVAAALMWWLLRRRRAGIAEEE